MGTIECSQPASKSSWDSQDFGDISMVLKWPIFASPPGHDELILRFIIFTPANPNGCAQIRFVLIKNLSLNLLIKIRDLYMWYPSKN